jgi:hypothetical protein
MYFLILKRYLGNLILSVLLAVATWFALIWCWDGWLPIAGFALVMVALIVTIPLLLYLDYREIRDHVIQLNEVRKGQGGATAYIDMLVEKVAEKSGLPSFLVAFIVKRSQKSIEAWRLEKSGNTPAEEA